jgi:hypothetical protein
MAGLKRTTVPVVFQSGVDTSSDPKVTAQALLKAEDAIFPRKGAIAKRRGTKSLAGTHGERFLTTYKNRPVVLERNVKVMDGSDITSGTFTSVSGLDLWNHRLVRTQVPEGEQRFNAEVLEEGNIRVWTYVKFEGAVTYDIVIESYERNSGRLIATAQVTNPTAGNNPQCRLFFLNSAFHFFYLSNNQLWRGSVHATTGAITGAVAITAGLHANNVPLDGTQVDANSVIFAVRSLAGNHIVVTGIDLDTATINSALHAAVDADQIGVFKRQDREAVIAYVLGNGGAAPDYRFTAYNKTPTLTIADTAIATLNAGEFIRNITGVCPDSDDGEVFYTFQTATEQPEMWLSSLNLAGPSVTSNSEILRKATVASKPIDDSSDSGNLYVWVTYDTGKYAYLVDQSGLHGAKILPAQIEGSSTATPVAQYFVARMSESSPWTSALRYRPNVGSTRAPLSVSVLRPDSLHCMEAQGNLHIPSSIPYQFDGEDVCESGFLHVPETVTGTAAGGGNLAAGNFLGLVVYEDRDSGNVLHRSSPGSPSSAVVSPGSGTLTWTLPYLSHTDRENVRVVFYRNSVTGGGAARFYRHPRGEFDNNTGADSFTFVDGGVLADDNITASALLYTDGDVLDDTQPPSGTIIAEHQGRQFIVDSESPQTVIRYSKPFSPGIAVEHSPFLTIEVPPDGGDITAMWSSMGWLMVAKASRVYAFGGRGLSNTLLGTGYGQPRLISEAIGCTNQKTVMLVPGGAMFQGEDRIWLLAGTKLNPVGDPVRFWTDPGTERAGGALVISCAVHIPDRSLAVFMTADEGALVYNYLYGQWATWTAYTATDGTEADGTLFFKVASDDSVRLTDDSSYSDGATGVVLKLETGWLSFAGIMGYKRVYKMLLAGQNITSHTLHVRIAYDMEPTWVDDLTFDSSTLTRFGAEAQMGDGSTDYSGMGYQVEINPSRQKCTSIRVQVYDGDQTGTKESFDIAAVNLVVGLKTGYTAARGSRRTAT